MSLVRVFITATATFLLMWPRVVIPEDNKSQCSDPSDTPFFPGNSCEDIYNKYTQSHNKSGHYWILKPDGPYRVYCGMNYTGSSCEHIYSNNPTTHDKSGYYRIQAENNKWVYCNMTAIAFTRGDIISSCAGVDGVWKRVANFNITAGDNCPSPWVKSSHSGVSFCRSESNGRGCYPVIYSTNGTSYKRVCGRASGYQKGTPSAFPDESIAIDGIYVEGISITHGNPRQHIWTYAVGLNDSGNSVHNCPCASGGTNPPMFVDTNYYCESGAESDMHANAYYLSDILWDGAGCYRSTCCSNPNLPWFHRQLSQTTQDDIEVRICMDQGFGNEAVLITGLELYI